jgi:hypothetical protein
LLIVSWSQCPHCSRLPQSKLLNKNLKIIIKKFIEAILKKLQKNAFFIKRGSLLLACSFFYLSRAVF